MMYKDTITVYNKVYDKDKGVDKYRRTVIENVHFEERKGANVVKSGLEQSDSVLICIPYTSPATIYIGPKGFEMAENKTEFFTLKSGDIVCRGEVDIEITSLKEFGKAQEYYTITSVDFYGFGSAKMQHWEVGAK